jgi:hypothetical protein
VDQIEDCLGVGKLLGVAYVAVTSPCKSLLNMDGDLADLERRLSALEKRVQDLEERSRWP